MLTLLPEALVDLGLGLTLALALPDPACCCVSLNASRETNQINQGGSMGFCTMWNLFVGSPGSVLRLASSATSLKQGRGETITKSKNC